MRRPKRLDWTLAAIALVWGLAELPFTQDLRGPVG